MKKRKILTFILLLTSVSFFIFLAKPLFRQKKLYAKIPISFHPFPNSPILWVEIEGNKYPFELDLGSNRELIIRKEILEKLKDKIPQGSSSFKNMRGIERVSSKFLIPLAKIENFKIINGKGHEESIDFLIDSADLIGVGRPISEKTKKGLAFIQGRVGMGAFAGCGIYIDFPRSLIYPTKDLAELKEEPCSIEGFIETPLSEQNGLWMIHVTTDIGTKKFLLDTGAYPSFLNQAFLPNEKAQGDIPATYETKQFSVEHLDFGPQPLLLIPIVEECGFDGVLGMDFFKQHAMYLDLPQKKAYIGPKTN